MQPIHFDDSIDRIVARDPRYHRDAYFFLRESLDHARKPETGGRSIKRRHLSGQEVLEGVRRLALEQFGPMARTVLAEWGIRSCEDFGEIVFNMVDENLLSKTANDSREHFKGGFDFHEAFDRPFLPPSKRLPDASEAAAAQPKPDGDQPPITSN